MRHRHVFIAVVAIFAAACGDDVVSSVDVSAEVDAPPSVDTDEVVMDDPENEPDGEDEPDDTAPDKLDAPPPVKVDGNSSSLELMAWTTCWVDYCSDGAPPSDDLLEVIVGDDLLRIDFPVEGWTFEATGRSLETECGRRQTVSLQATGATTFELVPFGIAGDRAVDLFGRGPGGDVIVSFRWQTAVDGELPTPSASLSLLANHDGDVDSYGVEFPISDLARTPEDLAASVIVTSVEGNSTTIEFSKLDIGCQRDGSLFLTAELETGLAAAALGEPPFTYDVTLVLDGTTHTARQTWPDDVDIECRPCVPLTFSPPLPAMSGS